MIYEQSERNKAIIRKIKAFTEKLTSGPDAKEKCRAHLIRIGIYNEDGTLHKDYGG